MDDKDTDGKKRNTLLLIALVVAMIVVAVFAVILLRPKAPAPVPAEDAWSRIKAAGKMVVGTAADYPPFEYYTEDFKMDGFDIALIRLIGERLGVQIELKDMAFDGLGGALQLGQIDVAIAALSITPEREQLADFSNVYYVGEDAILAAKDSPIDSIESTADVAGKKVGVQRASVYEKWAKENLVDTGLIAAENLLSYGEADQAVNGLKAGQVDLVMIDSAPALDHVKAGGVKNVGQGLNRQRFAIALPKGAGTLQAEINRALTELQNEGVIADLSKKYLDLDPDEILPLPTAAPPTATPVVPPPTRPPSCVDGMQLVAHLTLDDQNMTAPPEMGPGQAFVKSWRVRNSGTCPWDGSYALIYVQGNVPAADMGGSPVPVAGTVASNAQYDFHANLVAPTAPGTYQGFWQMVNGRNIAFGERVWVGIRVPSAATPAPVPTQTPSPNIQFSADRTHIKAGERVVFTWNAVNVKAVYFYAQGQPWQDNGVAGQGSREVWPQTTTIYELRVVDHADKVEIRQIRIEVEPVVGAPNITRFTVYPENQITLDQCVDIQWEVQGDVSKVMLLANNAPLWDGAPVSGSRQDCPAAPGEMSYVLEASGPGGTNRQQRLIIVNAPEVPPTATPAPGPPPLTGLWYLRYYFNGSELVPVLPGTEVSARFRNDGNLNGSSGCNEFTATYSVDGEALHISAIAGGQKTCAEPPGIMEQESAFLAALQSAASYRVADEFRIFNSAGQPVLRFVR